MQVPRMWLWEVSGQQLDSKAKTTAWSERRIGLRKNVSKGKKKVEKYRIHVTR